MLALYGVEPVSKNVDKFINWTQQGVAEASIFKPNLLEGVNGEGERKLSFNSKSPPYVLSITVVSGSGMPFRTFVVHESREKGDFRLGEVHTVKDNTLIYELNQKGHYKIEIQSSEYSWYAKVVER